MFIKLLLISQCFPLKLFGHSQIGSVSIELIDDLKHFPPFKQVSESQVSIPN